MSLRSNLDGNVTDQNGVPVLGALVYIYDLDGDLAELTDALEQSVSNPVVSGEDGYWSAYAEEGLYTVRYYWGARERLIEANRIAGRTPVQRVEASAAMAESLVGPNYPDTATGLAATTDGGGFAVDNGDGTVTVYRNTAGSAVYQRKLATSEALAATDGAERVGIGRPAVANATPRNLAQITWQHPLVPQDFGCAMDARMTGAFANNSGTMDPASTDDTDNFEQFLQAAAEGRPVRLTHLDAQYDPANPPGVRLSRPINIPAGRNNIVIEGPGRELFKIIQSDNFTQPILSVTADFDFIHFDIGGFTITRSDPGADGQGPVSAPALKLSSFHSGRLWGYRTNRMGASYELNDCLGITTEPDCFSYYDRSGPRLTMGANTGPNSMTINGAVVQPFEMGVFLQGPSCVTGELLIEHVGAENPNWAAAAVGLWCEDACHAAGLAFDLFIKMEGVLGRAVHIVDPRARRTSYRLGGYINRMGANVLSDISINAAGHLTGDPSTKLVNKIEHGGFGVYAADATRPYYDFNFPVGYNRFDLHDRDATFPDAIERLNPSASTVGWTRNGGFSAYVPQASANGMGVYVEKIIAGIYRIYPAKGWTRESVSLNLTPEMNAAGLTPRISGEAPNYVEYTWEVWNGSAYVATDCAFEVSGFYR